jgi:hypothetical protein
LSSDVWNWVGCKVLVAKEIFSSCKKEQMGCYFSYVRKIPCVTIDKNQIINYHVLLLCLGAFVLKKNVTCLIQPVLVGYLVKGVQGAQFQSRPMNWINNLAFLINKFGGLVTCFFVLKSSGMLDNFISSIYMIWSFNKIVGLVCNFFPLF